MLKVGLTGGIGSGKSTIAQLFEVLGIPVYYADEAAKRLMNTDDQLKDLLKKNLAKPLIRIILWTGNILPLLFLTILINWNY